MKSLTHSPAQLGWVKVQLTNFWLYRRAANDPVTVQKWGKDLAPDKWDRLMFDKGPLGLLISTILLSLWLGWWQGPLAFGFHVVTYVLLSGVSTPWGTLSVGVPTPTAQRTCIGWQR